MRSFILLIALAQACAHAPRSVAPSSSAHSIREDPLSFQSSIDRTVLHGTLSLPANSARGAVLLIGGSGKTDRDETAPATMTASGRTEKLFKQASDALVAGGFATLRYDKRGVLDENGAADARIWATADRVHLIADATDAARALAHAVGPETRLLILGHSEGTITAVEVALALKNNVAGLLLLGVQARPMEEMLRYQIAAADPNQSSEQSKAAADVVLEEIRTSKETFAPDGKPFTWYRQQLAAPANKDRIALVKAPVAVFHGEADVQTPRGEVELLREKRKDISVHTYPGLGHGFSLADNGRPTLGPIEKRVLADIVSAAQSMTRM